MPLINLILAASHIGTALLIILLCRPLLRGNVSRNFIYGFRVRKSLASDDNWYAINKYGAEKLTRWSWLIATAGILILFLPLEGNTILTVVAAAVPPLLVIVPCIQTQLYARQFSVGAHNPDSPSLADR